MDSAPSGDGRHRNIPVT